MNWQKDWWRYAAVAAVVVGLIWWRNRTPEQPVELTREEQVEERANRFLEEAGIEIPEGSERANLEDVTEVGATGVATRRVTNGRSEITVLAGLPATSEMYVGWLKNAAGDYMRMGTLSMGKGGYMLDYSGTDLEEYSEVVVSEEMQLPQKPTKEMLTGTFE